MTGKNVSDFTFKKKDTVVTMDSKSCAKVDGQSLSVDPQLLFQRLLTVARETSVSLDLKALYKSVIIIIIILLLKSSRHIPV